jgi:hypothetical protein
LQVSPSANSLERYTERGKEAAVLSSGMRYFVLGFIGLGVDLPFAICCTNKMETSVRAQIIQTPPDSWAGTQILNIIITTARPQEKYI